ncbi:MAG: hypothetical protein IJR45_04975 [Firmicutes bacterium]|nr:hypothetical protein [Bacillota bacterium]
MDENNNIPQTDEAFEIPGKKEKKSKLPVIVIVLAVVCVVLTAAALFMFRPESRIKREIALNFTDYITREGVLNGVMDENTVLALIKGEYDAQGTLQLEKNNVYDKINGIGLSSNTVISTEQRKMSSNNSIDYSGMTLAAFQTYMDEERSTFYIPSLFNESFTLENENVVSQLKNVPVVGSYFEDAKEFSLRPFAFIDMVYSDKLLKDGTKIIIAAKVTGILPKVKYEKNGERAGADGKAYTSYKITVPAEAVKSAYTDILKELRDSEEYKTALDKQLEFIYSTTREAEEQLGDKESAKNSFNSAFDDYIQKVENSDFDDLIIEATPVENGIVFSTGYKAGDKNITLNGDYDRGSNLLSLNGEFAVGENVYNYDYKDMAGKTEDGTANSQRSIEIKHAGEKFRAESAAELKADGKLNASFAAENGDGKLNITLDGKSQSRDGGLDVTADSIVIDAGDYQAELSGSFKAGTRTSEPQDVNAPEDVKVGEIDFKKALELYNEAKGKLEGLKKFSKLF